MNSKKNKLPESDSKYVIEWNKNILEWNRKVTGIIAPEKYEKKYELNTDYEIVSENNSAVLQVGKTTRWDLVKR